jgi:uncharacterized Zn finger protein
LLGGDLHSPYQFIQVAEAMSELGRDDDTLHWALRGIAETDGWQVVQLYDLAATVHAQRGDAFALLQLRREQFERMPSVATYGLLRDAAGPKWEAERVGARATLAARDRGALVDALLADGEADAAWDQATSDPNWDPGTDRWLKVAAAREVTSPRDAFGVYLRLADVALKETGRPAYAKAISLLKRARRSATSSGDLPQLQGHIAALRERYRNRPALLEMMDRASMS